MFPKSSLIMVFAAGALLLAACLINYLNGTDVSSLYLGIGAVLVVFSAVMFIFKRKS